MFRLLFGLGVVVVILTIYAVVDCAAFDRKRVRGVPKWLWLLMIIFIPVIGAVLWVLIGRGRRLNAAPSGRPMRQVAPDDDPDFLRGLDRATNDEQRIRDLEQELADFDKMDDPPEAGPSHPGTAGVDPKKTDPGESDQPGRRDA